MPKEAPVTTQPPPFRDWNDGLCDCTADTKNCLLTAFCLPCMICHEYGVHGEGCATPLCIPHPVLQLTSFYRGSKRIEGSLLFDCVLSTFCMHCQLCRLHRDFSVAPAATQRAPAK